MSEENSFGHDEVARLMVLCENHVRVFLYGYLEGIKPSMGLVLYSEGVRHGTPIVSDVDEFLINGRLFVVNHVLVQNLGHPAIAHKGVDCRGSKTQHHIHPAFSNTCPARATI